MRVRARLAATVGVATMAFVVADLILSRHSNVSLDSGSYVEFAKVMALLAAIYPVMLLVERRVAGDGARIAGLIRRGSTGVRALAWNAGLFIPLGFGSVYFMYLVSATDRTLADSTLALVDASLGFDWRAFLVWTNSRPALAAILVFAYHSVGLQMLLLFPILAFAGRDLRLGEFMAMLAVSSLLTAAIMVFAPAAGAYAYFQPGAADFSNFTARAGMWHYEELMKLRSGEPFSLLVTKAEGLATFPSYHTVLGILIVYALRDTPKIAWPIGILNAIMIVSTLPEGGHHLIDVLAGIAVGLLTIVCVRAVQKNRAVRSGMVEVFPQANEQPAWSRLPRQ
jgi:membrane-associated phospholipid phosphatase